ncbi:serine hydrolase [Niallia circulans]|uniref:serine hydrolase n=1 Tax=Niallia circulans TaxID=1397 RepID=UPI00397CEDCF
MNMEKLSKLINKIVQEYEGEGHFGIAMEWRGQGFFLNENDVFPSASLIKLPVMVESFMQSSGGTLALEDLVEVRSLLRTGGAGIVQYMSPQSRLSIRDLLTLMMIVSDNMATNYLIERLGMDNVNRRCQQLGMSSTVLQRKMMDREARKRKIENYTSPHDILRCLKAIYNDRNQSGKKILYHQQLLDKLPYYRGENSGIRIANKTGELDKVEHDCAIIEHEDEIIFIAILTDQLTANQKGKELIQLIGASIFECLYDKKSLNG